MRIARLVAHDRHSHASNLAQRPAPSVVRFTFIVVRGPHVPWFQRTTAATAQWGAWRLKSEVHVLKVIQVVDGLGHGLVDVGGARCHAQVSVDARNVVL